MSLKSHTASAEAWVVFTFITPIQQKKCPVCAVIYVLPPPKGKIICAAMCSEHDEHSINVDTPSKTNLRQNLNGKLLKINIPSH